MDRIVAYQEHLGLASEVEAARRLLDDALKQRDTFLTITTKLLKKRKELKSLRKAAREMLADHPLVSSINFREDGLIYYLKKQANVDVFDYGSATVYDQSGDVYNFHENFEDVPSWASQSHPRPKPVTKSANTSGNRGGYELDDDIPF